MDERMKGLKMKTTKKEYIKNHPKSYLAQALKDTDWPDNTSIEIVSGLEVPDNPKSNLCKALENSTRREYVRGGHRQHGSNGWWFAVA
jgi:hypothetical protein